MRRGSKGEGEGGPSGVQGAERVRARERQEMRQVQGSEMMGEGEERERRGVEGSRQCVQGRGGGPRGRDGKREGEVVSEGVRGGQMARERES